MTQPLSRRELLATAGAGLAIAAVAGQRSAHAETLTGGIKITMPVGELTDENLGVRRVSRRRLRDDRRSGVADLHARGTRRAGAAERSGAAVEGRRSAADEGDRRACRPEAGQRHAARLPPGDPRPPRRRRGHRAGQGVDPRRRTRRHPDRRIQLVRAARDGRLLRGAGPRRLTPRRARLRPQQGSAGARRRRHAQRGRPVDALRAVPEGGRAGRRAGERAPGRASERSAAAALSRHRSDPRLGRRPEARLRDGQEPGQRHHAGRRRHPRDGRGRRRRRSSGSAAAIRSTTSTSATCS